MFDVFFCVARGVFPERTRLSLGQTANTQPLYRRDFAPHL
jgi:hypothetical protein